MGRIADLLRAASAAAWLFGLYILFAGKTGTAEIGAGIATALIAAVAHGYYVGRSELRFAFRPVWLLQVPLVAWSVVRDCAVVGLKLLRILLGLSRHRRGAIIRMSFESGGAHPEDALRRGLVILGSSLAPNGFVVGLGDGELLVHRLARISSRHPPRNRSWPL